MHSKGISLGITEKRRPYGTFNVHIILNIIHTADKCSCLHKCI